MGETQPQGGRQPLPEPGLCGRCTHARRVASQRSTFLRCGLSDADPDFVRYPSLPVTACRGFTPRQAIPGETTRRP